MGSINDSKQYGDMTIVQLKAELGKQKG